jgi:mucin-2
VYGTVSAPQTLTVTVTKTGDGSPFSTGQVVTVSVGSSGQTVRVEAAGCLSGSSLSARQAELKAVPPPPSTTTSTTTTTTTTGHDGDGHHGRGDNHHGHKHGKPTVPTTTTGTTTTGTTTTTTTTPGTTTSTL